jgi:hypothetical protein
MPSRSKTQSLSVEPLPERRESEDYEGKDDYGDEKREKKHDNKRDGACGAIGKGKGWGYASMYLWFIVAPIVIWIILFTVKPNFVTDNINGVVTINNQKLLLWTLIFSIVAWIIVYSIYYCRY